MCRVMSWSPASASREPRVGTRCNGSLGEEKKSSKGTITNIALIYARENDSYCIQAEDPMISATKQSPMVKGNDMAPDTPHTFSWNDDQALKAMDKLEPFPDIKTICITGGAGFM